MARDRRSFTNEYKQEAVRPLVAGRTLPAAQCSFEPLCRLPIGAHHEPVA